MQILRVTQGRHLWYARRSSFVGSIENPCDVICRRLDFALFFLYHRVERFAAGQLPDSAAASVLAIRPTIPALNGGAEHDELAACDISLKPTRDFLGPPSLFSSRRFSIPLLFGAMLFMGSHTLAVKWHYQTRIRLR